MKLSVASFLTVLAGVQAASIGKKFSSNEYHAQVVDKYIRLWKGDLSLLNDVFAPNIWLNADRFPSSTGVGSDPFVVRTPQEFGYFITSSSDGWAQYGFEPWYWLGQDNHISIRWYLDGILGNFTEFPTTVKPGERVSYNGTDNLTLDPCTGKVTQVDSAQDLITFLHLMGLTAVTV